MKEVVVRTASIRLVLIISCISLLSHYSPSPQVFFYRTSFKPFSEMTSKLCAWKQASKFVNGKLCSIVAASEAIQISPVHANDIAKWLILSKMSLAFLWNNLGYFFTKRTIRLSVSVQCMWSGTAIHQFRGWNETKLKSFQNCYFFFKKTVFYFNLRIVNYWWTVTQAEINFFKCFANECERKIRRECTIHSWKKMYIMIIITLEKKALNVQITAVSIEEYFQLSENKRFM